MKSTITKPERSSIKFPCLMTAGSIVILATSCKNWEITGMVIARLSESASFEIGHYSTEWSKSSFKPFIDEVRLINDYPYDVESN